MLKNQRKDTNQTPHAQPSQANRQEPPCTPANPCPAMQTQGSFPWVARLSQPLQGAPDLSVLLDHKPAGAKGWVRVGADGHYYLSNRRIRFWGVNITAGACFPEPDAAPRMATQIAQAGCNIVRFHHMDAFWASPCLIDYARGNSRQFNAQSLARFDELFAQLRARGVYANLNRSEERRVGKEC